MGDLSYTLSQIEVETCKQFAFARMGGSQALYAARGEHNISKMEEDIFVGAASEIACSNILKSLGIDCSSPDFSIYQTNFKSFSADLIANQVNLHIKSQTVKSANQYGASWLFQKEDKLFSPEKARDLLLFCIVEGNKVVLKNITSIEQVLVYNLLKEPKVDRYKPTKYALYLSDIIETNQEGSQEWILKLSK